MQTRQAEVDATRAQNQRANSTDGMRGTATTPEAQLFEEVREFMAKGNFDAVARVRVGSHRDVMVPDPAQNRSQVLSRRQTLKVISIYQGTLPSSLDIITAPADRVNLHVDENREYIMFLYKIYVLERTYPGDRLRREYTKLELDAFGGEAFFYDPTELWVIDGQAANRVPAGRLTGSKPIVSHLEAARNGGQRLPLATIESELRSAASLTQRSASGATVASETATPTPAPEARIATLAKDQAKYDAVARVRVTYHREVVVPVRSTEWPEERLAVPSTYKYQRSNLEVLQRYHGTLPATFETVNPFFQSNPHLSLQVGQEYVLFVYKRWLPVGEHSEDERRIHYNQEQLQAIGGEGYDFSTENTWIVDGDDALLVPVDHIRYADARAGTHLEAARRAGESVPLTTLENYIRRATGNSGNN